MPYERNLIIVHTPGKQALSDFVAVRALIAERAPEIEVFIVTNGQRHSVTRRHAAGRPTLVFSPMPLKVFAATRGAVFACRRYNKLQEVERMAAGGVPVPSAVPLEPDTRLDPESWGPFTIVKPLDALQGKGVRLHRTKDVRWVDPRAWPPGDPRHGKLLIAQRFVDTGTFAQSHRVMTVFGRAVYCNLSRLLSPRPVDITPDGDDPIDFPVASNGGERTMELCYDAEIIDFARRVARCFPEIPVLGVDIIREHGTGRLFGLEANSGVGTWHLSSNYAVQNQRTHRLDYYGQFGALDIIADALIDATRREAA